jgi:hypothetical protein
VGQLLGQGSRRSQALPALAVRKIVLADAGIVIKSNQLGPEDVLAVKPDYFTGRYIPFLVNGTVIQLNSVAKPGQSVIQQLELYILGWFRL